jgi:nitroimidazol reductase NimA-like FMN-containing flavoprotein (pyridoxamine 5'-phosphate oxidase superfamily)
MQDKLTCILDAHGVMTIATVRQDGWPQATMVGYVRQDLVLYFLVSRTSQKFKNIQADDRISVAIGAETTTPESILGVSMSARAFECRDEPYRSEMLAKLSGRHPGYFDAKTLDMNQSALFRALPEVVSIIDFSKGLGHSDIITVGAAELVEMTAVRPDNWGANPAGR